MKKDIRVYCAGPLFNEGERAEMSMIATVLEDAGYDTFLPQRDGFEYSNICKDMNSEDEKDKMRKVIFSMDMYQLLERCNVTVANLNGRVPDEGTVVEASCSWIVGKPIFLYKKDSRSFSTDAKDNLMLQGIGKFKYIDKIKNIPHIINIYFEDNKFCPKIDFDDNLLYEQQAIIDMGRQIFKLKESKDYTIEDLFSILW